MGIKPFKVKEMKILSCTEHQIKKKIIYYHLLHNSSHFKETFKIVNLSHCHGHKYQGLKKGPKDHSGIGTFIDTSMDAIPHLHILLLMLDSS